MIGGYTEEVEVHKQLPIHMSKHFKLQTIFPSTEQSGHLISIIVFVAKLKF